MLFSTNRSSYRRTTDVINKLYDIFPNTVGIMLNIEPSIEKIVLHLHTKIPVITVHGLIIRNECTCNF